MIFNTYNDYLIWFNKLKKYYKFGFINQNLTLMQQYAVHKKENDCIMVKKNHFYAL